MYVTDEVDHSKLNKQEKNFYRRSVNIQEGHEVVASLAVNLLANYCPSLTRRASGKCKTKHIAGLMTYWTTTNWTTSDGF